MRLARPRREVNGTAVRPARGVPLSPLPSSPGPGRRRPDRRLQKTLKRRTLPWLVRLLAHPAGTPEAAARVPLLGERSGDRLRVLVVRQDNRLGNLILMIPFLRALRQALPNAEIGLLSGDAYAGLVGSFPWVDRWIVQAKRQHATQPWRFPGWLRQLRADRWDVAFEMSNHNTHSYFNCILTAASGAPIRIGFDEPRNANTLTHPVPPPDDRIPFALAPLELLRASGLQADSAPPSLTPGTPPSPRLSSFRRDELADAAYALIHVGGRGGKSWPLESWSRLVPRIRALGGPRIVLIGGPDEIDRMRALRERTGVSGPGGATAPDDPAREVVAPPFDLSDLANLLAGATYYVGCDTGVMHLAAAVATPTVALFFRSNPLHYAPLGAAHRTVLLADPYGANDGRWKATAPGVERSPLVVAAGDPTDSARGVPVVGPSADDPILGAVREVLRGALEGRGAVRPDSLRTSPS